MVQARRGKPGAGAALPDPCAGPCGRQRLLRRLLLHQVREYRETHTILSKSCCYRLHEKFTSIVNTFEAAYSVFRTSSENMISYWWMKEIYAKLPYHYKKNLKDFYTVHPSMWTRLTSWWFTTFMAPAIKQKLHNVYEVTEIVKYGKIRNIFIDSRWNSWTTSYTPQSLIFQCSFRNMTCP